MQAQTHAGDTNGGAEQQGPRIFVVVEHIQPRSTFNEWNETAVFRVRSYSALSGRYSFLPESIVIDSDHSNKISSFSKSLQEVLNLF
jgi:hypothetical protein